MPQHNPGPAPRRSLGLAVATTTAAALTALLPATPAAAAPQRPVPVVPVSEPVAVEVAPIALPDPAALTRSIADINSRVEAARVAARNAGAMSSAMSKLGKPYVYGATGPNAFDCSGLVGWAYKQVGVSLPRTSSAQSRVGTPVAKSDLRPGDLVFFYSPVSHVAIYIGGGKVVHASTSGQPVKISALNTMPFNSARRV
ncbi:C40 family peptidase [Pseudonocardia sp. CA-107938]|uniref:C40 family peptidase n=1 Tax=Pseudonocardia sp. CA-107938 TaxID=3240021 RepID=UPI003D90978F